MNRCPRCGRYQPREHTGNDPCVHCGQFMATVEWVAWPPGGYPARGPRPPRRYTGPPAYRVPPRWGFPLVTWRRPTSFEPVPASDLLRARSLAGTAQPLLWLAAATALLAAAAEVWRYVLLLDSRADALPAGALRVSDALVTTGGVVSLASCGLAGLITLLWVLRAVPAAAELAGVAPARSGRELLFGWLVPGINLFVPGSTLAEIEHAVLRRPAGERPRPGGLVTAWWACWATGLVFAAGTALWSLRGSTQAMADGVLLHALVDVLAAATAVLTALVLRTLTGLLQPAVPGRSRRMVVVRIYDDRPDRPAGTPTAPAAGGVVAADDAVSAGDGEGGEAADDELRAPGRLAGQPQPG